MFNLKDKVRDTVTGYEGVITAKAEYISRETQYLVESIDNTGRPIEWWEPAGRLEHIN